MRVWIDQSLCTGSGLCAWHAPGIFTLHDDGLPYVGDTAEKGISEGAVPADREAEVITASEECPGECIFIEV